MGPIATAIPTQGCKKSENNSFYCEFKLPSKIEFCSDFDKFYIFVISDSCSIISNDKINFFDVSHFLN